MDAPAGAPPTGAVAAPEPAMTTAPASVAGAAPEPLEPAPGPCDSQAAALADRRR